MAPIQYNNRCYYTLLYTKYQYNNRCQMYILLSKDDSIL